jgi:uncharacterized membrane protein
MAERSFADRLARETETWVAEGVVTAEQAAAIRARYGEAEDARSRTANALAIVGAVAVGVGVIAFFAANWDGIPKVLRLALLVVAVVGCYWAAFELRDRSDRLPRVGAALYMLGVLLFGASLFLVGQMYNVEAHDPLALLIWAAGAAAVAAVVQTPPLTVVAFVIFTAWIAWEAGTTVDSDEEVGALLALAVPYGAALYGLGTVVRERVAAQWVDETGFAEVARRLGFLLGAFGLFALTFVHAAEVLPGAARDVGTALQALAIALGLAAFAAAAGVATTRRPSAAAEAGGIALVTAAALALAFTGGDGGVWAVVFNVLVVGLAVGAIAAGYVNDEAWLVNVGVLVVAVELVLRYFDLFWDAVGRSLGILGAGLVILAVAYGLERQRRRMLARMDA